MMVSAMNNNHGNTMVKDTAKRTDRDDVMEHSYIVCE